jgi:hypothetical protein
LFAEGNARKHSDNMPFRPANLVHTDEGDLEESKASEGSSGSTEPGSLSSAVERRVHIADVVGSIPTATTTPPHWGFTHPAIGIEGCDAWFEPCFIYILASGRDEKPVKIGLSADVERRIKQFEAGNPYGLRAVWTHPVGKGMARQVESRVHALFAPKALGREWFEIDAREASLPIPLLCKRSDEALAAYRDAILNEPALSAEAEERVRKLLHTRSAFARARAMMQASKAERRAKKWK